MAYRLTQEDLQVMEAAARIETGGMSAFTSYYFALIHGTPRWDLVATSPDTWDLAEGEFVPWVPLAWQMAVAHDKRLDATIIAGFGSGKTVGIEAVFTYWCCMIPNFKQLMKSERPLPRGNEFTPELLEPCQSREMDDVMRHARENHLRGYYVEEAQRAGTVLWVMPPNEFDRYVLIGDPGQNTPPDRNSGVVVALKVTGFPQVPAEVAAFHWVDGQGSYWPFINQMEEWYRAYRPIYTAFDASGTQKGFDELVFAQKGMLVEGVQVNTNKMRMVVALKLILGKQKLLMPREIQGIWMQLAGWRMPDTKLRQDIASCLFIAADVLNRLFIIDEEQEAEEDDSEYEDVANVRRRPHRRKATRHQRTGGRIQR